MPVHAILSDIHANLTALQAVLADVQKIAPTADLWVLGDTVMYGPNPLGCLQRLQQQHPTFFLMGNNDHDVLFPEQAADLSLDVRSDDAFRKEKLATNRAAMNWTREQLKQDAALRAYLESSARGMVRPDTRWQVVLVHASPCNPLGLTGGYIYEEGEAEEALLAMRETDDRICFMGHTHMAVWFEETTTQRIYENCKRKPNSALLSNQPQSLKNVRMLINPGSVGQPRNGDARAHYALWDDEQNQITFRRVNYDIEAVIADLQKSSLSDFQPKDIEVTRKATEMLISRFREAY